MSEQDAEDGEPGGQTDESAAAPEGDEESLEEIAEEPEADPDAALSAILDEAVAADLERETIEPRDELVEQVAAADTEAVALEVEALRTRVETIERELEERETAVEDLESRLARKQADFQNYKQRQEERLAEEKARATEDLVSRLLDVRDNLARALDQDEDADIRGGVESTLRQFDEEFERENVERIEPEPGEETDPQRHEVLMRVESDRAAGTIADVHRPGYEMAGTVIRAAQVTVSEGSDEADDDGGDATADGENGEQADEDGAA